MSSKLKKLSMVIFKYFDIAYFDTAIFEGLCFELEKVNFY
jgi:hypothetical protein